MKRTLLFGHDAAIAAFVADMAPIERPVWPERLHGIGILRTDGRLIAGVVFATTRPDFGAWEMSAAGVVSAILSIEIASALGQFAFRQPLHANRVWARTSVQNLPANRLLERLGFTREGVSADHYGVGVHAATWRLLRREWERQLSARWPEKRLRRETPLRAVA